VILTAPAVFRWTSSADYDRHVRAAELLGINMINVKRTMAGDKIAEYIITLLNEWSRFVPNGLAGIGYGQEDIDALVKGTLPQKKVLDIAPRQPTPSDLQGLFEKSMKLF
jgi:hydroxyacid-oxoacid transhydrogenase